MTAPKPKPTPGLILGVAPDPPEPGPDDEPDTIDSRVKTLEAFVQDLGERLMALEERAAAPPIGLGRRP